LLEPLTAGETDELIERLLGSSQLADDIRDRISAAAEGNPLFVEQLVAHQAESGNGALEIPPTVQALLAARIDRLAAAERAVIERAAVEGRFFHRGSVQALLPVAQRDGIGGHLLTLVRKELVRPDRSLLPGDDGFRFGHILIRDAAYDAIPKRLRAELHEQFAAWVAERLGERALDEIIGYHLEQAHRYYEELDRHPDARRTADAAAERLGAAGRRALARGDARAAANLLQRAASLVPRASPAGFALTLDAGTALTEIGELARADELLSNAILAARATGDRAVEFRARLAVSYTHALSTPDAEFADVGSEAKLAIDVFDELGDDAGLGRAWHLAGLHAMWSGRAAEGEQALQRALAHARAAGDECQATETLSWFSGALFYGPTPAREVERLLAERIELAPGNWRVEAWYSTVLVGALAMQGRFADARARRDRAKALVDELGPGLAQAWMSHFFGWFEQLQDDLPAAEAELRKGYEMSKRMGETGYLSTTAAILADVVCAQGRTEEALRLTEEAREMGSAGDVMTEVLWRVARAKTLARLDRVTEAEGLAREAVARIRATDDLNATAGAIAALADILRAAGRTEESVEARLEAIRLYERKGNVVMAQRMREAVGETNAGSR
jgi:tetratricopeptide (TPR) repeat protein